MQTRPRDAGPGFSPRERQLLTAIAEAVIPPGAVFPGAGAASVRRVEKYLHDAGSAAFSGYRAMLWAVDASSLLRHGRSLHHLTSDERTALLEGWRTGDYARRLLVRALYAPLKVAHFNDPELYRKLGCVYGVTPPAATEKPRWMHERVRSPEELDGETLECDVVVIGTGAGGAVVAKELAERGVATVMIEEGEWFTRSDFNGQAVDMQRKMFRDMGATFSVGNVGIPIPVGKTVGGSTTINSGTCYRVPERVLASWREHHGLTEFSSETLDPFFSRVESILGVAEARAEHLGGVARLIARGCDALGFKHKPLRRNAPDCDGQGVCCFGCPTDAKRSTNVSYVPLALKAGATLIKPLRADRILVERGRAVGVVGSAHGHRVTVRAKAVVVACGTLLTPLLLMENGLANSSGQLGRNLSIHPAAGALALFDEEVKGWAGIPQGYSIEEFRDEGLLFEGVFAPMDIGSASISLMGDRFMRLMEAYDRVACFGFMIEDSSRGRVRRGPGGRPLITYFMNDHDVARMKRGVAILSRVYFAAGAKEVYPTLHGFDVFHSPAEIEKLSSTKVHARDFEVSAFHPLGTARMGLDASSSVVGTDHQVHDVPGLYIVDGSAVPSSLAVNPQLTIMALATRAAEKLANHLG